MIKTYLNKKGTPIIRKCGNCIHYKPIDNSENVSGYCKLIQMYFAFTHEKSVYAIVKDFYLCEKHTLENEETLKLESKEVDLESYLMDRNAQKKS
jgi:hypothetical protein